MMINRLVCPASCFSEAHEWLKDRLLSYSTRYWPDSGWNIPALPVGIETAFSFERPNYLDVSATLGGN
jgi:hypothetical protein